ncbi:TolC family protein [Vibrio sp. D420a]|uniref:TolC family protein n=1 Tax=Vibrio sp. D420a TaxID=2836895 RepID=UPI002552716A|nr:TolC family protein [Vibrio sp. D420a]
MPAFVMAASSNEAVTSANGSRVVVAGELETLQAQERQLALLIDQALQRDSGRQQIIAQSQATRHAGIASATLSDPKLKVGFGGLPVDSFKFDEDPMTNISVGLMQQFERGSTLDLKERQSSQQADGIDLQVAVREREITNTITTLWLELGYQQAARSTLLETRRLMVELERFIETNYGIGNSEAQDLLNAQLNVAKFDEKLQANQQQQRRIIAQLSEWLGSDWLNSSLANFAIDASQPGAQPQSIQASNVLSWQALEGQLKPYVGQSQYYALLQSHPMVRAADTAITVNETQVEIAEQAYLPQFGVEVMYAYRQANNMQGNPASDLVSAYVTMDIPLFTGNRQDKSVEAAQYQVGSARAQKETLLSQMNAKVNALLVDRDNLSQRIERYQNSFIPQADATTKAVERGYQNNTAQFNDVITAMTNALNIELEQQRLITDLNIVNSQLAALVGGSYHQPSQSSKTTPQAQ